MDGALKPLTIVLVLALCCISPGLAQTQKGEFHVQKAREFMRAKDPKSALQEARKAVGASEPGRDQVQAVLLLARIQSSLRMVEPLLDTLELGLALPLENFPLEHARLNQIKGREYLRMGRSAEAKMALSQAIEIAEAAGLKDSIPASYNMMGIAFNIEGDNPNGLLYMNQFLGILERNPDRDAIAMANVNIGTIHLGLEDYEQAEKNFRKAQSIMMDIGKSQDLAQIYRSLSMICTGKGLHQQAKLYLDSALVTPKGPDDPRGKAITLANLVEVYEDLGEPQKALATMRSKIELNNKIEHQANVEPLNFWKLADLLDQNGQQDSVAHYYQKSIRLAEEGNFRKTLLMAQIHYSEWLKKQKQFEEALEVYESYSSLSADLTKEESEKILAKERARFEVLEAKSELKEATNENVILEETNTLYTALLVALGLLFIAVCALLLLFQRARKRLKVQNDQLLDLIATKNKFFSIIAHDIRSPLVAFQNIGKRIQQAHHRGDSEKLQFLSHQLDESATQLNGLLNNLLSWALLQNDLLSHRPGPVRVEEVVLDNIDLFEDLARMKNISMESEVPKDLTLSADENALQLMVRNLIGNAIKFTPEGGRVSINALEQQRSTIIQVKDTGPGIPANKMKEIFSIQSGSERGTAGEKGVGLGLYLVSELMRVHQGKVKADAQPGKGSVFTLVFQN